MTERQSAIILLVSDSRAHVMQASTMFPGEELHVVTRLALPTFPSTRIYEKLTSVEKQFDAVVLYDQMSRAPSEVDAIGLFDEAVARARWLVVVREPCVEADRKLAALGPKQLPVGHTGMPCTVENVHDLFSSRGLVFARSYAGGVITRTDEVNMENDDEHSFEQRGNPLPGKRLGGAQPHPGDVHTFEEVYHCGLRRPTAIADRIIDRLSLGRVEIRPHFPYHVRQVRAKPHGRTTGERAGIFLPSQVARHEERGAIALCGSKLPDTFDPAVEACEVGLYRFRDCVVCGHNLAILDPAGRLDIFGSYLNRVDQMQAYYFRDDVREVLVAKDRWETVRRGQKWVLITNRGWESYFHWVVDCMPSVWFALRYLGAETVQLVTPPVPSFAAEMLAWLGVRIDQVHFLDDVPQYFEELYFPESLHARILCFHPRMGDVLSELAGILGERPPPRSLLYVTRADARRRRLVNEADVEEALQRLGFTIVSPGRHSVAEQRRLFASARLVVGPHGAGLTNLVFMHPGTAMVELHYPGYLNPCYYRLAQVMDVRYHTFLGDGEGNGRHTYKWWVDVPKLVTALSPLVAEASGGISREGLPKHRDDVHADPRSAEHAITAQES